MDNQMKHILVKWYNTDTNVETPMAYDHVISVAQETIDELVKFNQEREILFQEYINKLILLVEKKEILDAEHQEITDKLIEENIGV